MPGIQPIALACFICLASTLAILHAEVATPATAPKAVTKTKPKTKLKLVPKKS